jgi:rSAM/selenodomain-associated transferase 1
MTPPVTVIVMAKAPVAGFAKTRLIPTLGAEGAAALAERMLRHAVAQARGAGLGPVELCCAPDQHHAAFASLYAWPDPVLSDQGDGDLGARMARAFERRLSDGHAVLMIGTDAPALDAAVLRRAAEALSQTDAVFVPALDGGYALIGLRRPAPSLFSAMTWSTSTVMAHTRERLAAAGLRHTELAPLTDIDEAADLVHLPHGFLD